MIFESPLWLLCLLALPLIAWLEVWLTGVDRDRIARLVARPLWARVLRRPAARSRAGDSAAGDNGPRIRAALRPRRRLCLRR